MIWDFHIFKSPLISFMLNDTEKTNRKLTKLSLFPTWTSFLLSNINLIEECITHCNPNNKKTNYHKNPVITQWRSMWLVDSFTLLHIKHQFTKDTPLFFKQPNVMILPQVASHAKKVNPHWDHVFQITLDRKPTLIRTIVLF